MRLVIHKLSAYMQGCSHIPSSQTPLKIIHKKTNIEHCTEHSAAFNIAVANKQSSLSR